MKNYINNRGISDDIIKEFNITWKETLISFPYGSENAKMYKYSNEKIKLSYGAKTDLYGAMSNLVKSNQNIILTEGVWDALSLQTLGYAGVTNTTGVMNSLKALEMYKKKLKNKIIYVLFDYDEAGIKATYKIWKAKIENVRYCYFIKSDLLKEKGDVNDYILANRNTEKDIKDVLNRYKTWEEMKGFEMFGVNFEEEKKVEFAQHIDKSLDSVDVDRIATAKAVRLDTLISFNNQGKAICPWHHDSEPSLIYYKETNTATCFACGESCDSIKLAREGMGVKRTFFETLDFLAGKRPQPKWPSWEEYYKNKKNYDRN